LEVSRPVRIAAANQIPRPFDLLEQKALKEI